MTRTRLTTWLLQIAALAALVAAWSAATTFSGIQPYILPPPTAVLASFVDDWRSLLHASAITLYESLLGLLLAFLMGATVAVALHASARLRQSTMPLLVMFNSFPKVALAPLLIVWLGLGLASKVVLSAMLAFFPITVNLLAGFTRVEPDVVDVLRGLSASRWVIFRKVSVPNALPYLMDGLKIAIPLAVVGALVGEFVGARQGLGYLLLLAGSVLDAPLQYATVIMMGAIALAPFYLVSWLQRALLGRWQDPDREALL